MNDLPLSQRLARAYARAVSLDEIRAEPILQWMFGAMLFYFFVTFSRWITLGVGTAEAARSAICWPYFQGCAQLYVLHALPYGYTQNLLYMGFYGAMLLIVWCMWSRRWEIAHALLSVLLLWKLFVVFVLSYTVAGPYDYYHIILTLALLYVPHKEYFLKLLFVFMYFMSVTVKFTPAWIAGTYFTAMVTGAPLMPEWFTPVATNIVIFVQIVECWFLLSKNRLLQRISLSFALFFHLYSGLLVNYDYPSVTLPAIAILFGPLYRYQRPPFSRKAIGGWTVVLLVAIFQLLGFALPSDRYLSLEGNRLGMFMFEANHQCAATVTRYYSQRITGAGDFDATPGTPCDGFFCLVSRSTSNSATSSVQRLRYESGTAWNRCDPYEWWERLHDQCEGPLTRIGLTFDHSINGGPFYRIVDLQNICGTDYSMLHHNDWIMMPPQAQIVGYPVQNWYHY